MVVTETRGTAYESLRVGLSHASKIITKLVRVAELQGAECTLAGRPEMDTVARIGPVLQ